MAVIQNIPESKQTPSAQNGLLKYCMRPEKTNLNEQVKLVSGHNCLPEMAHKSFLATQALYKAEQEKHIAEGKENVLFYQYVQSFSPKDDLTPEQAHAIGMQFVREYFPNHEVVVATHLDNNQLHNHFVINATSFKDGSKLHMNKYTLADMRQLNDEICLAHGLSVLKPYDPSKPSMNLGQREYRAQEKGQSWKFELLLVITDLMKTCGSKEEFIKKLREKGYDVRWEEHQKTMKLNEIDERRAAQSIQTEVRNELDREVAEEKPAEPEQKPVTEPEQAEEQDEEQEIQAEELSL